MEKRTKVYIYTRVSTAMQVEGYSLDAQVDRIQKYVDYREFEIVGKYTDAGKSGKSIEGRPDFKRMMNDISNNKDGVSFVVVFKLSRFGRNTADVLNSLQYMQDYGVNLICVEESLDSSKETGKVMISILSAVAEMERENILIQTMAGRKQKAREGKWNGGFAPYGYELKDGKLYINEEEAEAIRTIFGLYANTEMGSNGIAKHLKQQGVKKIPRKNGTCPVFSDHFVRMALDNPVYCGNIAFGRRSNQKVEGTRNEYKIVRQEDYMVCDGIHDAIIDEDMWNKVREKRLAQAKKYEHVNIGKNQRIHLMSGLLKCPICGAGMYGNKSIKNKNGKHYKDYYFYGCKHRSLVRGGNCTYRKQLQEDKIDDAVAEIIAKLVGNPKFAKMMKKKINMNVDTKAIDAEIANYERQISQFTGTKTKIENQLDNLDVMDKHYDKKANDLQERLDKMYDNIDDTENSLEDAKARKKAIEGEKLSGDNVYKLLMYFDKVYDKMDRADKRSLLVALIDNIQIFEEEQTNGQWLKSIQFKLPLVKADMEIGLDNGCTVERTE